MFSHEFRSLKCPVAIFTFFCMASLPSRLAAILSGSTFEFRRLNKPCDLITTSVYKHRVSLQSAYPRTQKRSRCEVRIHDPWQHETALQSNRQPCLQIKFSMLHQVGILKLFTRHIAKSNLGILGGIHFGHYSAFSNGSPPR